MWSAQPLLTSTRSARTDAMSNVSEQARTVVETEVVPPVVYDANITLTGSSPRKRAVFPSPALTQPFSPLPAQSATTGTASILDARGATSRTAPSCPAPSAWRASSRSV